VALFTVSWLVSIAVYKWRGFDNLELRSDGAGLSE